MTSFQVHTEESAPEASLALLERAKSVFGAVPNLQAVMAESPLLLEGYQTLYDLSSRASFSAVERQVVFLAVSYENACEYCMAAHSFQALKRDAVPAEIVTALREKRPLRDPRLEALRGLAEQLTRERGRLDDDALEALRSAGFTKNQILEVILLIAVKVLSSYTNHLVHTPLDKPFASQRWQKHDHSSIQNQAATAASV
jgi:uncharacterized peroxidase-related enzyme